MKNKLFVYHGGGYDGCIWEWNAAVWDAQGEFRDVASSGCTGLWTDRTLMTTGDRERQACDWLKNNRNHAAVIDLAVKRQVKAFYAEYNAMFTYGCLERLASELYSAEDQKKVWLFWTCTDCGREFSFLDSPMWEDYHGDGGVGIVYESRLCEECYSAGQCRRCNTYWGRDQLKHGHCDSCYRQELTDVQDRIDDIENDIARIRSQAEELATLRPKYAEKTRAQAQRLVKRLEQRMNRIINQRLDG